MSEQKQQANTLPAKERLPYYDNVKFVLIVCVVIGHIIKFGAVQSASEARALSVYIYSFHMPCFIFLSGLFLSRSRLTLHKTINRVFEYVLLGLVAKLLRKAVPLMLGQSVTIDLLTEGGLPWFMFALAAFYLLAWLLKRCDFVVVGAVSVAFALYAGYVDAIGDYLCLSRIIVFFPFFWLGHALSPQVVRQHFAEVRIKLICVVILVLALIACLQWSEKLYPYRDLFLARFSYALTPIAGCSWTDRFACYIASLVMSYAVLGVVPQGHVPLMSVFGTRTLQVYLLHYEVIELLDYAGVIRATIDYGTYGWFLLIPLGVALAMVLSLPHVPAFLKKKWPAASSS